MLDGKYEIISQRPLGPNSTLFDATAPNGAAVRVAWYSLEAAEEAEFERYRTLLRKLKRGERAAIYDLVSRPGAHYVAWLVPPENCSGDDGEQEGIAHLLESHGWALEDAHLCADKEDGKEGVKVYGLAFERSEALNHPAVAVRPQQPHRAQSVTAQEQKRRLTAWSIGTKPWLPGTILALLGMVLLASSFYRPLNREFIVVPNVRGQEVTEALSALQQLGLNTSSSPVSSSESIGQVLSSEPSAGAQLRPGRTVHLRYALPPGQLAPTDVPGLNGLSAREAEQQLAAAGLALGELSRIHSASPSGEVIAQSWEGQAPIGSAVDLLVSEGPQGELTFLPDLTGMTLAEANALIRAAGLGPPEIERVSGTGQRADIVVSQNIIPNQLIAQDAAALRLSVTGDAAQNAPPLSGTGVPNFTGMTLDAARRLAQREGLRLRDPREISSARLPTGVITQDPPPGTRSAQSVALTLNRPPSPVPTPAVAAEVRSGLDDRGEPRRIPYSWRIQEGTPEQLAQVTVETLSGEPELIAAQRVRGGERLEGTWQTSEPGPVTFTLTLDGLRYGERLTINP